MHLVTSIIKYDWVGDMEYMFLIYQFWYTKYILTAGKLERMKKVSFLTHFYLHSLPLAQVDAGWWGLMCWLCLLGPQNVCTAISPPQTATSCPLPPAAASSAQPTAGLQVKASTAPVWMSECKILTPVLLSIKFKRWTAYKFPTKAINCYRKSSVFTL